MAFTKKTWTDRLSEYPNRRQLTKSDGTTEIVDVARLEGTISQEGDGFTAENMNDFEQRIADEFNTQNDNFANQITALNNAKVIYNEETDALDVYANGILVGSLECNFQIYPIDFIADTINTDWTIDSGNKLTIGTTFKTTSNAVSAKYVTFNEPIKISEGAVLNIVGNLYLGAGTMPGTTIYGYHNVQISKDGGVTWDTINSATLNMKSVYNTSGAVSKAINLDAYAGYDILLRICTYHTRTDDASGTWYDVTLTQFDITYP